MSINNKTFHNARTDKEKLNQLINLAYDTAEMKLRDGTASSQIIALLLEQGSEKRLLELEKLKSDIEVANARIQQLTSESESNKQYLEAIEALKTYKGSSADESYDEYEEY